MSSAVAASPYANRSLMSAEAKRYVPVALWLAYLLIPVEGWGLFPGRPIGLAQAAIAGVVSWIWWTNQRFPFTKILGMALAAKLALGATLVAPRGLEARYFANPDFSGTPEPNPWSPERSYTRIDNRLQFGIEGAPDFPLYFLND